MNLLHSNHIDTHAKPLRVSAPALYNEMVKVAEQFNVQPYDLHAQLIKKNDGYELKILFSYGFSQTASITVSHEQLNKPDEVIIHFFNQTAEDCKQHLIKDYFKILKV